MTTSLRARMLMTAALLAVGTVAACGQTYYTPGYSYDTTVPPPAPVYAAPPVAAPQVIAAPAGTAGQAATAPTLTEAQLDDLLGPIALYPDPLLAEICRRRRIRWIS